MRRTVMIVAAIMLGFAMVVGALIPSRTQLLKERQEIDDQWSQVNANMKQRADLVPNLIVTIMRHAGREQSAIGEASNARAALLTARSKQDAIRANNRLSGAIQQLLLIEEKHPKLRSDENFVRLQDELADAGNRIAVARYHYNAAIKTYNLDVEIFPKNIAAAVFGLHRDDAYFQATAQERQAPPLKS